MTPLIISNKEMDDIIKIVKSLKESNFLLKSVSETPKNKAQEQKYLFLGMLFGTLAASILGSALAGKIVNRAAEKAIRAGQDLYCCLIL